MKTLLLSNLFPPHVLGGYEILCGLVAEELGKRGHSIRVLTSNHGLGERTGPSEPGVERALRLYLPFDRPPRIMRWRRWLTGCENYRVAREAIERFQPDVVFVWSALRLTVGPARAAERSGVPVAYTFNDENILAYRPGSFSLRPRRLARWAVERWLVPSITLRGLGMEHCTCISRLLRDNLVRRGLPAKDIRVIYQGVPIEKFPLKGNAGGVGRPARLLYAGQLHAYKGVHTAVRALARIASRRGADAACLTVVGEGPADYKQQLREEAASSNIRVEFRPRVPHDRLSAVYREHDIFVFPSVWQEPFGLAHLEAMASGLPVVSTADGGHGEFLEDGKNALVFAKEDDAALAGRLLALMDDPALARRLAKEGRQVVEERFALDRYVSDLDAFLREVASK